MNRHNQKNKESKTSYSLKTSSIHNNQTVGFLDNRPAATAQLKAQQMANEATAFSTIQKKENKTGMPDQLKSGIESLSGLDMSDVKVHYNSAEPGKINAHAYAQGTDIHIANGREKHLPHEAWHAVQQKQGRVQPTIQMKGGVNLNDDAGLEKEADVMGAKAMSLNNTFGQLHQTKQVRTQKNTAQRILKDVGKNILVSTSDKTTLIDANNAAITVAATKDEATGGHAEIYLELFENGIPVEYSLDMFGANEGRVVVRMKRYDMGEMNSRRKGGSKTYAITTAQADHALVAATRLKIDAESKTLKYTYYLPKMWNLNLLSSVTYMNCADFAAVVLNAAGIAGSTSGVLSMPKTVAN